MPTFKIQNESCHQSNHSSTPHNLETLFDTSRTDEGILIVHVDGKTYNLQLHTTPEEETPQNRVVFTCENISFFTEDIYNDFKNHILGLIQAKGFSNDVSVTFNTESLILNEIVINIQNVSSLQQILEFVLNPDEFTTSIITYLYSFEEGGGSIVLHDITITKTIQSFTYTTDNQELENLINIESEHSINNPSTDSQYEQYIVNGGISNNITVSKEIYETPSTVQSTHEWDVNLYQTSSVSLSPNGKYLAVSQLNSNIFRIYRSLSGTWNGDVDVYWHYNFQGGLITSINMTDTYILVNREQGLSVYDYVIQRVTPLNMMIPFHNSFSPKSIYTQYNENEEFIAHIRNNDTVVVLQKQPEGSFNVYKQHEVNQNIIITSLCFHPIQKIITIGLNNGSINVWNYELNEIYTIPPEGGSSIISCLSFSPDGNYLVSGSIGGSVIVYNFQNIQIEPSKIISFIDCSNCVFSSDGKYLILYVATTKLFRLYSSEDEFTNVITSKQIPRHYTNTPTDSILSNVDFKLLSPSSSSVTVSVQSPTVNDIKSLVNIPSNSTQVTIELEADEIEVGEGPGELLLEPDEIEVGEGPGELLLEPDEIEVGEGPGELIIRTPSINPI